MSSADVQPKKFIVLPLDALSKLEDRHPDSASALERAKERCAEEGRAMYVIEMRIVVTRETPPLTVRKL